MRKETPTVSNHTRPEPSNGLTAVVTTWRWTAGRTPAVPRRSQNDEDTRRRYEEQELMTGEATVRRSKRQEEQETGEARDRRSKRQEKQETEVKGDEDLQIEADSCHQRWRRPSWRRWGCVGGWEGDIYT